MQLDLAARAALVAISTINGGLSRRGQPKAIGLVPNSGRVPPAGATQAWLGVQASPTSPASVNGSISANSAEKCTQRLIASAAMPLCRAFLHQQRQRALERQQ
jgi:hypothetical protein